MTSYVSQERTDRKEGGLHKGAPEKASRRKRRLRWDLSNGEGFIRQRRDSICGCGLSLGKGPEVSPRASQPS